MKTTASLILLALFILSSYMPVSGYNLRQINNRDNLSNNSIISMFQDSRGLIWIGTCDGLNMYNGRNVSVYEPVEKDMELSGNLIDNITEAEEGVLWVRTYYGLDRVDRKANTVDHFVNLNRICFSAKDKNNNFYILQENNSIFYYSKTDKLFKKIYMQASIFDKVLDFFIDHQNVAWIVTSGGYRFSYDIEIDEEGKISLLQKTDSRHSENIICSYNDKKNIFYVDDKYDLYGVNLLLGKVTYISNLKKEILKNGDISSIVKYRDDYFVGFRVSGLYTLRKTAENDYIKEKIPINCGVFCMMKDRYQDVIWIGTDGQGVYTYSNESYSITSTLLNDFTLRIGKPIRALFLDKENTMWIGSKGDGIMKIYDYDVRKNILDCRLESITTDNSSLNNNSVYAFASSSKNILWIGNEQGLNYYSYKDNSIKAVQLQDGDETLKYIHGVYEQDSVLWLASVGMGFVKANIKWKNDTPALEIVKRVVLNNGDMSSNYFFSVYAENDSTVWFANRGDGAFRINTYTSEVNQIEFNTDNENKTLNEVFSIIKDNNGNYLFGTSSGLVKRDVNGNCRIFDKADGFPNNTIHSILQESENTFWLSTNRGIINYNSEKDIFRTYEFNDRLSVLEFSDGASFKDERTGILYFGGINGFVSVQQNNFNPPEYMPPLYFDNLTLSGKAYNIFDFISLEGSQEVLELDHTQSFFSVSFIALDYLNGNNYIYSYKLEELSDNWIDKGNSNVLSLTNFSPGEYTLHVKYFNKTTEKDSPVYKLKIRILPPWYRSTLAYIIYIFLLLAIVGIAVRKLIHINRTKKNNLLKKIEQQHKEDIYESKLRFFTHIAHEFCTPLTLIYGPCSRILSNKNVDDSIVHYIKVIRQNAERLNLLIQDLIEFRRIDTNHRKPHIEKVDVSGLLEEVTNSFVVLAESRKVNFEKNIPSSLKWNSDANFLATVFTNLISNAFKYMSVNGSIKVSASVNDDNLYVTISNTGKGIKAENISKVFDRYSIIDSFEKTDNTDHLWSRNGLGLAISSGMVNTLEGKIEIESTINEWTHFRIVLPLLEISTDSIKEVNVYEAKPEKDNDPIELWLPANEIDYNKPIMLVIDDEKEILWLINDIFNESFNVLWALNTDDAKAIITKAHPDIIISDVMMQGPNGLTFTKELKSDNQTSHIPLILLSANHEMQQQIEGMDAGAELYITKPFNVDYLKSSVQHLISRKETLKNYFSSSFSAFELSNGKFTHKEDNKLIKEILEIIDKNICDPDLSVGFIAAKMNISTRSLYRKVSEISDISIADMIRNCRLHIAEDLLIKTKLTTDEIVFKSGFSNRVSFFKAFSKKNGCTPKEFRGNNKVYSEN